MVDACSPHAAHTNICLEIEKERDYFEDLVVDGRLIQERMFKMWDE